MERGGGQGFLLVGAADPVHPHNPHYAVLEVKHPGEGVGLTNTGFGGIPVRAGQRYDLSLFARTLFVGERWAPHEEGENEELPVWAPHEDDALAPPSRDTGFSPLVARLESQSGEVLGEAVLPSPGKNWTRLSATITAGKTDEAARFVLLMNTPGGLALDVISLFPQRTFRGRPNGLRADLAQMLADLKPKFVRFPGGCLVHGNGLGNLYRWKDTIGPIEERREQANLWGYHQTVGLGYFEYFQFCEDIGAKPLPVVAAGVCCQNSGYTSGQGQKGLPLDEMPAYIQDVLDLIEWANGSADSFWGAQRARAGHSEPFGLEYLGVGNEDHITPAFQERFTLIYEAVKAKHPEITVVGTVGPSHSGRDYDAGWKIARELNLQLVDEHYYEKPDWFWENLPRYDACDRAAPAVYLGEYAAHESDRKNTLRSALAEAAYMTALERNGDVVRLASYAPLLAKRGHFHWVPDLIYFDNTQISLTINYYVQQLFAANAGDVSLPAQVNFPHHAQTLAVSCVQDRPSGDLILKIVSRAGVAVPAQIGFASVESIQPTAICTVLTGDPTQENDFGSPAISPQVSDIAAGERFAYEVPAHSLSVIRLKTR